MTDKKKRLAVLRRKAKKIQHMIEATRLAHRYLQAIAEAFDLTITPTKRG